MLENTKYKIIFPGALLTMLIAIVYPKPAFAYLDPGTMGMAVQIIIAAVAGSLLFIKMYWAKLKEFIKKNFKTDK